MLPLLLPLWLVIIGIMAILAAGCVVGFFLGESHRKKVAEAKIGSAEEEARRLVNDAVKAQGSPCGGKRRRPSNEDGGR